MSYADQQMSGNRLTALIIVALIHVVVGYALVTGLAYEGMRQVLKKVTTVDIKKDEPKKQPPPPPKNLPPPPPIVAPPPPINVAVAPPVIQTVQAPPPPVINIAPPAAPPPPKFVPKPLTPRGDPRTWVTNDDYPPRAQREGRSGVTAFRLTVSPDGKVTECQVTSSSGSSDLDETACSLLKRRGKFQPPTGEDGQPTTGYYSNRFHWVLQSGDD